MRLGLRCCCIGLSETLVKVQRGLHCLSRTLVHFASFSRTRCRCFDMKQRHCFARAGPGSYFRAGSCSSPADSRVSFFCDIAKNAPTPPSKSATAAPDWAYGRFLFACRPWYSIVTGCRLASSVEMSAWLRCFHDVLWQRCNMRCLTPGLQHPTLMPSSAQCQAHCTNFCSGSLL
jgi:hypothetical protein